MKIPTDEASWRRFALAHDADPATTSMDVRVDGVLVSSWSVPEPREALVLLVEGGRSRIVRLVAAG